MLLKPAKRIIRGTKSKFVSRELTCYLHLRMYMNIGRLKIIGGLIGDGIVTFVVMQPNIDITPKCAIALQL